MFRNGALIVLLPLIFLCSAQGCAGSNTALRSLREGREVLASMDDIDTARVAAISQIQRLEEYARVDVVDPQPHILLSEAWARYALLFLEDDIEDARERNDQSGAAFHAMRCKNAYERAVYHGSIALEATTAGFAKAVDQDRVVQYLDGLGDSEPALLLWLGAAWLGRVRMTPDTEDRRELFARAQVGEQLIERSLRDGGPNLARWGHLLLGLWRGRLVGGDPVVARNHLEQSFNLSSRSLLLTHVVFCRTVVCATHDRDQWDKLFQEVIDAKDPAPDLRLANAVAKKRAVRDRNGPRRSQCVP